MKHNGYTLVSEISSDLLGRAKDKAYKNYRDHLSSMTRDIGRDDDLYKAFDDKSSKLDNRSNKFRIAYRKKLRKEQDKDRAERLSKQKKETEEFLNAKKSSRNKKIALGAAGLAALGLGTAAYLKHRRNKKKEKETT